MGSGYGCTCDYCYTKCPQCRAKMDAANEAEYLREIRDWTVESIVRLAKRLGVELDKPPDKRDY